MDAVSQHGGRARRPVLESWAARLGVAVIVGLSIWVGVKFWWPIDPALAVLTIGAELIAFAGLAVGIAQFPHAWGRGLGALLVTLIAAGWCAMTMFQKIEDDSRREAIAQARETPAYVFAKNAAETARDLLQSRLAQADPRPTCNCPQTVAAWEAAEGGAINRLRAERDAAVTQMQAAIPPARTDLLAIARGIGVEIAKLIGFTVFWLALAPPSRAPTVAQPRQPFEVVEGGRSTDPPTIARPTQPAAQPKRRSGWLSMKGLGNFVTAWVAAHATQPALNHSATNTTIPANQMVEAVVESIAAPILWEKLGNVARYVGRQMERAAHRRTDERALW